MRKPDKIAYLLQQIIDYAENTLSPAVTYLLQNYYGPSWKQHANYQMKSTLNGMVWKCEDIVTIIQDNWATAFQDLFATRHLQRLPNIYHTIRKRTSSLFDAKRVETFLSDMEPLFDILLRANMTEEYGEARNQIVIYRKQLIDTGYSY